MEDARIGWALGLGRGISFGFSLVCAATRVAQMSVVWDLVLAVGQVAAFSNSVALVLGGEDIEALIDLADVLLGPGVVTAAQSQVLFERADGTMKRLSMTRTKWDDVKECVTLQVRRL